MAVALLSMPMAYAAPSPTEPDRPPVEIEGPDVPLSDIPVEIEDPDVPQAYVPAPQTGVTGLSSTETLTLAAIALALGGTALLTKATKQTGR